MHSLLIAVAESDLQIRMCINVNEQQLIKMT